MRYFFALMIFACSAAQACEKCDQAIKFIYDQNGIIWDDLYSGNGNYELYEAEFETKKGMLQAYDNVLKILQPTK